MDAGDSSRRRTASSTKAVQEAFLRKQSEEWRALTDRGRMDSVICTATTYLKEQERTGFVRGAAYASYYIAQAYHFKGIPDSADFYLGKAKEYFNGMDSDPTWQMMLYNLQALTAIKTRLDYPEGISSLEKALEIARREKQQNNEIILLCNIVTIYYNRRDTLPRPYAETAYALSRKQESSNLKCYAAICMGEMSILRGDTEAAGSYLKEADSLAQTGRISNMEAPVCLLFGDNYRKEGHKDKAALYYRKALEHLDSSAPEVEIELCAAYGSLLLEDGDCAEAKKYFRRGLEVSKKHNDREQLHNLYQGLAETFKREGQNDSALKYYVLYNEARDRSAVGTETERQLGRIGRMFASGKQDGAGGATTLPYIAIAAATAAAIIIALNRARKPRKSDAGHQKKEPTSVKGNQEEALFKQVSQLMQAEALYCDNDISLVKVAEKLGTNRSYVSKVINSYAGTNFLGYINKLRIDRAEALLSDPDYDKPLKVLAAELGYNSLSVFYRAFQRQAGVSPSRYRTEHRFRNS